MESLHELITINDLPYEQLNQTQKERIDIFIDKLKEAGLTEKLIEYKPPYNYIIFDSKNSFSTNLPKDLTDQMDTIWVHIKA